MSDATVSPTCTACSSLKGATDLPWHWPLDMIRLARPTPD
jgi:hypothetical protein